MLHAAKIIVWTAIDMLTDSCHIQQAQAEFARELAVHPYTNPIPEHIQLPRFLT